MKIKSEIMKKLLNNNPSSALVLAVLNQSSNSGVVYLNSDVIRIKFHIDHNLFKDGINDLTKRGLIEQFGNSNILYLKPSLFSFKSDTHPVNKVHKIKPTVIPDSSVDASIDVGENNGSENNESASSSSEDSSSSSSDGDDQSSSSSDDFDPFKSVEEGTSDNSNESDKSNNSESSKSSESSASLDQIAEEKIFSYSNMSNSSNDPSTVPDNSSSTSSSNDDPFSNITIPTSDSDNSSDTGDDQSSSNNSESSNSSVTSDENSKAVSEVVDRMANKDQSSSINSSTTNDASSHENKTSNSSNDNSASLQEKKDNEIASTAVAHVVHVTKAGGNFDDATSDTYDKLSKQVHNDPLIMSKFEDLIPIARNQFII